MATYQTNPADPKNVRMFNGAKGKREKETFADIEIEGKELSKHYVVSSYGRVFSVDDGVELKTYASKVKPKYKKVKLAAKKVEGKPSVVCAGINTLVANAFIPKTKKDIALGRNIVHAIDWDSSNSRYSNLMWTNQTELYILKGIKSGATEEEDIVKYICMLISKGYTNVDIKAIVDIPVKAKVAYINKIRAKKIFTEIVSKFDF